MLPNRVVRRVGLDSNPLRRPVDLLEAWLRVALATAFLLFAPAVAWHAGHAVERSIVAESRAVRAANFQVTAVLEEDVAVRSVQGVDDPVPAALPPARARWQAPDGTRRRGEITPVSAAVAGDSVAIWTDAHGTPVEPPPTRQDAAVYALGAALIATVALAFTLTGAGLLLARACDRHRLALWQAAWRCVEPRWSGRG